MHLREPARELLSQVAGISLSIDWVSGTGPYTGTQK